MANAAYIVDNQGMADYLEEVLEVASEPLRLNIMRGGFRDPARLVTRTEEFIHSMCMCIRKSGEPSAQRHITAELEEDLQKFRNWCTYRYMTQRDFAYAQATRTT